jgi:signal peptidase I
MIPTLKIGDHILVSKLSYGFHLPFLTKSIYQFGFPQRGDIVVFTREDDPMSSEDDSAINIIKRVIGLPGDTIEVIGSKVYINNREYVEPYARWDEGGIDSWGPEVVPEGKVLLLGDNRDHSKDSRYWTDPFLPVERVKGRALIIYWTWDSDFLNRIGKIIE